MAPATLEPVPAEAPSQVRDVLMVLDQQLTAIVDVVLSDEQAFPKYHNDLTVAQADAFMNQLDDARLLLREIVESLGIARTGGAPKLSVTALERITKAQVAIREYRVARTASAPTDDAFHGDVQIAELGRAIRRMSALLGEGGTTSLEMRAADAGRSHVGLAALPALEHTIEKYALVEYRPALRALLQQAESRTYEIAVFGRVSSGKSSLLNALVGHNVLPVGVTPVTEICTRIAYGEPERAMVCYLDGTRENVAISRLREFVSEEGNPANSRHVKFVDVFVSSDILKADMALVDTPGVGSLARAGARATFDYLPRCDLAVLVIDSTGAPTPQDEELLKQLAESGISAVVVMSKADQLADGDRAQVVTYAEATLGKGVAAPLSVQLVSSVPEFRHMARDWYVREIAPRTVKGRATAQKSMAIKLQTLGEAVTLALQATLRATQGEKANQVGKETARDQLLAIEAEGVLHAADSACADLVKLMHYSRDRVLGIAVDRVLKDKSAVITREQIQVAVHEAAQTAAEHERAPMRHQVVKARDQLREILVRIAKPYPFIAIRPDDLTVDVIGQPEVSLPVRNLDIKVARGFWWKWFPGLARKLLETVIGHLMAPKLEESFRSHAEELTAWFGAQTHRLWEQFEAQSAVVTAHATDVKRRRASLFSDAEIQADLTQLEASLRKGEG